MKTERKPAEKGTLGRVVKMLFKAYPVLVPVSIACMIFSAIVSSIPALFIQKVLAVIEEWYRTGDWEAARPEIISKVGVLVALYVLSITAMAVYTQLMAYITQGFLSKMRVKMFDGMQNLPIKYFDTHKHGDIMSYYTNDIDTLRQLVSQALPQLVQSSVETPIVYL